MLVATIAAKDYHIAHQILGNQNYPVDAIELRLDYFNRIELQKIKKEQAF